MTLKTLLTFLCACAFAMATVAQTSVNCPKRCTAYHTDWTTEYKADQVPFEKLTHIFHAFISPQPNGKLKIDSYYLEPDLTSKAHAKGTKVLICIGGGGGSADANFRVIAASPNLRAVFADSITAFCLRYGYDGVDIDWESTSAPLTTAEAADMVKMISTIRKKFNATSATSSWEISMAIPQTNYWGQNFAYDSLSKYVDFYNLMTYDSHGGWGDHFGHNSPLYAGTDSLDNISMETSLNYILNNRKIPAEKINAGIPFYGYLFPKSTQLHEKCPSNSCAGVSYYFNKDIDPYIDKNGWTRYWDDDSKVPYLLKDVGTGAITYEDSLSAAMKVSYAIVTRQLGGVAIYDLASGFSNDGTQPQMEGVYNAFQSICGIVSGTEENQFSKNNQPFDIYPNPSIASFTIHANGKTGEVAQLQVSDYMGRVVKTTSFPTNASFSFGDELNSGIYICTVSYKTGTFTKTIVKK